MLHRGQGGQAEPERDAGRVLGILLRRKALVLLAALALMILAGAVGRDAGDKLVSGATWTPRPSRNAQPSCSQDGFSADRPTWS